jgi:hypothetical protein
MDVFGGQGQHPPPPFEPAKTKRNIKFMPWNLGGVVLQAQPLGTGLDPTGLGFPLKLQKSHG